MRRVLVSLVMVTTLLVFSGCTERIVYVQRDCPKLQTWKVDKPSDIHFTVNTKD